MDRKTDTVYSRIYVFCAGQEEKCLNGDTYLSNKQHYVLVKKGDDTYKVPYPFDCDRTVEALNRKNSEEEALTAAQRLFLLDGIQKNIAKTFKEKKDMKVKRMIESDVDTFKVGDIIEVKLTDGEKHRLWQCGRTRTA